jgi:uncharacterized flavoprotein (TIGR03862 family)
LEQENLLLSPLEPANCGFDVPWSPYIAHRYAGSVLKPVSMSFEGETKQGELTITEKGLEGSLMYHFSMRIRERLKKEGVAELSLDLRRGLSQDVLIERLSLPRKARSFSTYLQKAAGLNSLSVALLREVVPPEKMPINDVAALASLIKNLLIKVKSPSSLARAISTAGGVRFEALNDDLMILSKKGVFCAGEMLDWEAPTGGYLLQACFSTGRRAAQGVLRYFEKELLEGVDE